MAARKRVHKPVKRPKTAVTRKAELKRPFYDYTREAIENSGTFSESEARSEYSRLRSIAKKRLQRLASAGYDDSSIYRYYKNRFPTLKKIKAPSKLYNALADAASFVISDYSTVSGQRDLEERVKTTLAENYGTDVDMDLKKFGHFMDYMRAKYHGKEFDSERAVRTYRDATKKGISLQQLERHQKIFYDNQKRLGAMKSKVKGMDRERTAMDYVKALNKRGEKRAIKATKKRG